MKRVAFVGSKKLGASVLACMYRIAPDYLCAAITFDDTEDSRSALNEFREFSKNSGIPLRILSKGSGLKKAILEYSPDLVIVVGWYWVLKPDLLSIVPEGWLGIHGSLLPENRGGAPLVWAIIKGQSQSGLSLFYFDEGMDTGDIVAQKSFLIGNDETIADVLEKVEVLSVEFVEENYLDIILGKIHRSPQDHQKATYVAMRTPEDGKIDWRQPAACVYNFIRAQTHPYPGAFCMISTDLVLKVWDAKVFPYPYYGAPGQVVQIKGQEVIVTCGEGSAIVVRRVQVDGEQETDAGQVLKFGQRLM